MDRLISNQGLSHLVLHILSYVDIKHDMINCKLVCKDWKDLIESSIRIWKRRLKFVYMNHDLHDRWKDFREAFSSIQESKDLEKVKKFVFLLEKYIRSDSFRTESPLHWYANAFFGGTSEECMFFVDMVSSLNEPSSWSNGTVFMLACSSGNVELVRSLLDASKYKDIDLNASTGDGLNGLMRAARYGYYEIVKVLFDKSRELQIDLTAFCEAGCNVFVWALKSDVPEMLDLILKNYQSEGIQLNSVDIYGRTSFMEMCFRCHRSTNVIDFMIESSNQLNISFNDVDEHNETGFLLACRSGNYYAVEKLLDYCRRINYPLNVKNEQETGLEMACYNRYQNQITFFIDNTPFRPVVEYRERTKRTVEVLLKHAERFIFSYDNMYLNVNSTKNGRTALMKAASTGRDDLVELFIKYADTCNIDFNLRDNRGLNVLLMPTVRALRGPGYYESGALALLLKNVKRVGIEANTIIRYGKRKKKNGWITSFHQFCLGLNANVLEILFEHSEDVLMDYNAPDFTGQTGFMKACESGLHLNVRCLILNSQKVGIDLNATDNNWMTGYMLACKNHNALVVEMILQHSADYNIDLNANDRQGRNGFDLWKMLPKKIPFPTEVGYWAKRYLFFKKIHPPNFNSDDIADEQ